MRTYLPFPEIYDTEKHRLGEELDARHRMFWLKERWLVSMQNDCSQHDPACLISQLIHTCRMAMNEFDEQLYTEDVWDD